MPERLQSLSEKILQIRSNNTEPDKQITVKYLSEIITARIEEIMMAMLYEINESGFADMLRSGIVITGGVAQTANLCNFIYELSGYRVRTGYPKQQFSNGVCDGLTDTTAATSVGLIMAAKDELAVNCAYSEDKTGSNVIVENEDTAPLCAENVPETEGNTEHKDEPEYNGQLFSSDDVQVVEKPKKQKPKFDALTYPIPSFIKQENWNDFVAMRKEIKKPLTETAAKRLISKLTEFDANGFDANESLDYSIMGQYQGVFERNRKQQSNNQVNNYEQPKQSRYDSHKQSLTEQLQQQFAAEDAQQGVGSFDCRDVYPLDG